MDKGLQNPPQALGRFRRKIAPLSTPRRTLTWLRSVEVWPRLPEHIKAAKIFNACFYKWVQEEACKTESERQRNEPVEGAFGMVAQNIEKAVSTLVGLLDAGDDRVKRLTANDIIGHYLEHKELKDLEERITAIEERLEQQK